MKIEFSFFYFKGGYKNCRAIGSYFKVYIPCGARGSRAVETFDCHTSAPGSMPARGRPSVHSAENEYLVENWGGKWRRGKELATLPHNVVARDDVPPTEHPSTFDIEYGNLLYISCMWETSLIRILQLNNFSEA